MLGYITLDLHFDILVITKNLTDRIAGVWMINDFHLYLSMVLNGSSLLYPWCCSLESE